VRVFLKSTYVRNSEKLTDFEFLAYTGLRMIYREDIPTQYVSLNQIIAMLFGRVNISHRLRVGIKKAVWSLMALQNSSKSEKAQIKPIAYIDGKFTEFIMDLSLLHFDTEQSHFVMLKEEELRSILNMEFNGHIESVFRYYCVLLSTFNHTENINVGGLPLKSIRCYIDSVKSTRTQLCYNRLLEKYKVLYIHHNDYMVHDYDSVKSLPNFYGRYEDKAKVDAVAIQKYNSIINTIDRSSEESNELRSLKQKINAIGKGAIYSEDELNIMHSMAEKENKRIYDIMAHTDDDMLKSKLSKRIINLSIFR
jgi:hypothetical protein